MERKYYNEKPDPFETIRSVGAFITIVRFNISESEDEEQGAWQCDEVTYGHKSPLNEGDYGALVSTLVRSRFSADEVEAILNNYLGGLEAGVEDFDRLQQWRAEAKQKAKDILGYGAEQGGV